MLIQWANRWRIPPEAMQDLINTLGGGPQIAAGDMSEAAVQQRIRLEASRRGARLWRNNVGVLVDDRGVPVRYGLANDSKAMNQSIKSADLIGITPVHITSQHVGHMVGVFTSYEVKRENWTYRGDAREVAQAAWGALVRSLGGIAKFVRGVADL